MKNIFTFALIALAAFALSACGGGYTATNTTPKKTENTNTDGGAKAPEKSGPSMVKEYRREMEAAFAAHDEYEKVKKDKEARKEPYIQWAEHLYAALAYANMHANHGYSKDDLPRFKQLKELRSGYFKYALGPSDDPRVKAAMQNWQDSTKG